MNRTVFALRTFLALVPCFGLMNACTKGTNSSTKGIIGQDNLTEVKDSLHSELQGILNADGRECNAFLIGRDVLVTALHCVDSNYGDPLAFSSFSFKNFNGKVANIADVSLVDAKKDIVIYKLDGYFASFYEIMDFDANTGLKLVSYDFDTKKFVEDSCKATIASESPVALEYTCDTKKGFSGAPLLQNGAVVGFHIGHSPKRVINYGLNFKHLYNDLADISSFEKSGQLEFKIKSPHIRVQSPHIRTPQNLGGLGLCSASVGGSVNAGAACAACIASAAGTAGATAIACAAPCGTSAGTLTALLGTCQ